MISYQKAKTIINKHLSFLDKEREAYNTPLSAQTPNNKLGGQDEF